MHACLRINALLILAAPFVHAESPFTDTLHDFNEPAVGFVWTDENRDNQVDLRLVTESGSHLVHNLGEGTFEPTTSEESETHPFLATWADTDGDRDLEPFTITSKETVGARWIDYDHDGHLDLYLLKRHTPSALFRNDHSGNFTPIQDSVLVRDTNAVCQGMAWGDYDNDGDFDLFIATQGACNQLYQNDGNGRFTPILTGALVETVDDCQGAAWGDYDNDGKLDLITAHGPDGVTLYRNLGKGHFERSSQEPTLTKDHDALGANWADADNDGKLDLFAADSEGRHTLFRNDSEDRNWLFINLIGMKSNRDGIGAKIRVMAVINGEEVWQMREINTGNGRSSNDPRAHFGLGDAECAKVIRIEWPSGAVMEMHEAAANQFCTIPEDWGPPKIATSVRENQLHFHFKGLFNNKIQLESSPDLKTWETVAWLETDGQGTATYQTSIQSEPRFFRAAQ